MTFYPTLSVYGVFGVKKARIHSKRRISLNESQCMRKTFVWSFLISAAKIKLEKSHFDVHGCEGRENHDGYNITTIFKFDFFISQLLKFAFF